MKTRIVSRTFVGLIGLLLVMGAWLLLPAQIARADEITVTATFPVSNTHTAPVDSVVAVTYTAPISVATVSTQTFAVHAMQTGLLTQTYGVNGGTISLTPTNTFKPGELVQVSATTGTLSITGTGPLTPMVWQFWAGGGVGPAVFNVLTDTFGGGNSRGVALGDVDGDGDLDAVAVKYNQAQDVYFNDGSGSFGAATSFGSSGPSRAMALGDVDGDGDLDVVVANYGAAQDVYLNNGSGGFTAATTFGSGSSEGVALGDVDGDGDLDAVVANWGQAQDVHLNDGSGSFGATAAMTIGSGSGHNLSVALGDVDGDGDLDVVVAGYNAPQDVHLNDGSGNFGAATTFGSGYSNGVALGDVDGDGDLDVVVANFYDVAQDVYLNNGSGGFTAATAFGGGYSYDVALGDVDGDGDLDAVVANHKTGDPGNPQAVHLNDGNGNFGAETTFGGGVSRSVALGDVDGDGDLDAVVANYGQAQDVAFNEAADLDIIKSVTPSTAQPGDTITYTLTFSNAGAVAAAGVVITDSIPISLTNVSVVSSGVAITDSGASPAYVWNVQELAPGQGGLITITANISSSLAAGTFTNTASIATTAVDIDAGNNSSSAGVQIPTPGISVTTTLDEYDTVANGTCSLREAIQSANTDSDFGGCSRIGTAPYTITLSAGTYVLTQTGTAEDANLDGDLDILTDTVIVGAGAESVIIDGNANERVFHLPGAIALSITNVSLSNGSADYGGGLYINGGSVTLSGMQVYSNSATGGWFGADGGGLYVNIGSATLIGTQVYSNAASRSGGGLYVNTGSATLIGTQVYSNAASKYGGGLYVSGGSGILTGTQVYSNAVGVGGFESGGGGVYVSGGSAILTETQVYGNLALGSMTANGGGLFVMWDGASATLVRSQVYRNSAIAGGGLYVAEGSATLTETHILSNTASTSNGGGLRVNSGSSHSGSIIAANGCIVYNSDAAALNLAGTLTAQDNWWGAANGPSGAGPGGGDSVGSGVNYSNFKSTAPAGCPSYPSADLSIVKSVTPTIALPGEIITYTLIFTNNGPDTATGVVINDNIPVSLTNVSVISKGDMVITQTQIGAVFETAPILAGQGGLITITANISSSLAAGTFTNTATITTTSVDSDAANNSSNASVTVQNAAPVAVDDAPPAVDEDSSNNLLDVLSNDSDANGDSLSISAVGTPDNGGTAVANAGQIDYTPVADFAGTEIFTYTASDGNGGSDTATVTVTVTDVNDPPTFTSSPVTTATEDTSYSYSVTAGDPDEHHRAHQTGLVEPHRQRGRHCRAERHASQQRCGRSQRRLADYRRRPNQYAELHHHRQRRAGRHLHLDHQHYRQWFSEQAA